MSAAIQIPKSTAASHAFAAAQSADELVAATRAIVEHELAPQTARIDTEGLYPKAVMHSLGAAGAFRAHLPDARADGCHDFGAAIRAMAAVSQECLSTGFATWCQDTCAWYLQVGEAQARERWLEPLASGRVLGGTGMSNTMKAFSGIEDLRLSGERVDGGYLVNGSLPWVSNLGADHVFGSLFTLSGDTNRTVMALVDCSAPGFTLRQSAHFVALEGTRTFACLFDNVFIPDANVIDHDGAAFLQRARAGLVLLQFGMGAGNIQGCIDVCRSVEPLLGHVNQFLDDRPDELQQELDDIVDAVLTLAETPYETSKDFFREILQLRLAAGELALRASQSAMLHTGAKGYLSSAPAQRKLRESYFVAIVTPATKHLRKELARMEAEGASA
ncbi:acyl-CoA dehydrogenase family protein [uncultured Thiohalocapsa sp.]|uniref:acyl-CoA dehydrogenase family protein n=1 Tax=uncultured Thiohalocapsa sp. TaxID=768990 RepID=UPI0025ECE84B|nr:acyl-CoA dehydrogenase family protein [uncultured Thiohalocapsa sp.]